MPENPEILDENINPIPLDGDYDSTSEFDEGYSLPRITFKSLIAFVLSVLNFERGILFTIKELFIRPKVVIEEYMKKDRKKLINPIRFLVFSTALSTFLMFSFMNSNDLVKDAENNFEYGFNIGFNESLIGDSVLQRNSVIDSTEYSKKIEKAEKGKKVMKEFGELIMNLNDKFTFILVFFFALFCTILFKRKGYNYTENLVINCFNISMMNVLSILFVIPAMLSNSLTWIMISSVLSVIYILYFWMMVYEKKGVGGFFLSLLNYILSYVIFSIGLAIFAIIFVIVKLA